MPKQPAFPVRRDAMKKRVTRRELIDPLPAGVRATGTVTPDQLPVPGPVQRFAPRTLCLRDGGAAPDRHLER